MEQKFVPIVTNEIFAVACNGMNKEEIALFKKLLNKVYDNLNKTNP
jgi:hypothetical protein